MRALALLSLVSAAIHGTSASGDEQEVASPFLDSLKQRSPNPIHLFKRQSCPSGASSCSNLGNSAACCPSGTTCAKDANGNVACCPNSAVCTGVISGSAPRSTATTASTPFVLGGTTSTAAAPSPTALASGYSTVPNNFYPFVAIPTTYANAQSCLQAYSTCQSVSTACLNSLAGQNGVTVSGLGSLGVTQTGAAGEGVATASSICSSLYQQGCYGLQSSVCSNFGGSQTTGFVEANAGPAANAKCTGAFYTAAAVVGAGLAGFAMGQ